MVRRAGRTRMVVGGIMAFLLAPAIFALTVWIGVRWTVGAVDEAQRLAPGQAVRLESAEKVTLLMLDQPENSGSTTSGRPATTCTARTPTAQPQT